MLDFHVNENGFNEVYPPFMVREECMYGTGQLPKFGDNLYKDIEEDFYFIPTAEVPLTNMYRDEILEEGDLPVKNVAFTALLSFAYQTVTRSYLDTATSVIHENTLNSLILGTNFNFKLAKGFTLITNLESNVYSFGYNDTTSLTLPTTGPEMFLFRLTTGVSLDLDLLRN